MKLDPAQEAQVQQWIEQGLKVAEIQTRLADQLGVKLTYMEARLLLDDLRLKPKDVPRPVSPVLPAAPPPAAAGPAARPPGLAAAPAPAPDDAAPAAGGVQVGVDTVTRPGFVMSGRVTFSDGQKAAWYIDQYGRPGLAPETPGYRPSQADVMDFQAALEAELAKSGMY